MNEDLAIISGGNVEEDRETSYPADVSEIFGRFNAFEQKLDRIISLLDRDVKIDEANNDKVGIAEAEEKITEKEEYREAGEEKESEE